jgi:hypothetical protein
VLTVSIRGANCSPNLQSIHPPVCQGYHRPSACCKEVQLHPEYNGRAAGRCFSTRHNSKSDDDMPGPSSAGHALLSLAHKSFDDGARKAMRGHERDEDEQVK